MGVMSILLVCLTDVEHRLYQRWGGVDMKFWYVYCHCDQHFTRGKPGWWGPGPEI